MILIDSNVIISYINKDDSKHKEALLLLNRIMNKEYGNYIISDYIFDEIATVAFLRTNRKEAFKIGDFLLENVDIIKIVNKLFFDSWTLFKQYKKLSFTDCTNLAIMKELGINAIATFDKDFIKEVSGIEIMH